MALPSLPPWQRSHHLGFLLCCVFLCQLPRRVVANGDDLGAGRVAGIVIGVVCVFVIVGCALGCVVWRQQRGARRRLLHARQYAEADDIALDEIGAQQPGEERRHSQQQQQQQPSGEGRPSSVPPSRVQSRLSRVGGAAAAAAAVPREEREGAQHNHDDDSDGAESHPDDDDDVEVTISGVPIENRVRPRNRPPKGTVVVRHEDRQIKINFSQLSEILEAEPPPLTAEELQRLEDEQNRVASPEFYGRGDYLERPPDAPASPVEYIGSFSSLRHLSNQFTNGRAGSNYAASNASDYHGSGGSGGMGNGSLRYFSPNSPSAGSLHGGGYVNPGGGVYHPQQQQRSRNASSIGSQKESYPESFPGVGGGGSPRRQRSPHSGREGEHSGGNTHIGNVGDSPLTLQLLTATAAAATDNGKGRRSKRGEVRRKERKPRQPRGSSGTSGGGGWVDSMESTSDDFEDHESESTPTKGSAQGTRSAQQQQQQHLHHPAPLGNNGDASGLDNSLPHVGDQQTSTQVFRPQVQTAQEKLPHNSNNNNNNVGSSGGSVFVPLVDPVGGGHGNNHADSVVHVYGSALSSAPLTSAAAPPANVVHPGRLNSFDSLFGPPTATSSPATPSAPAANAGVGDEDGRDM